jgi:hypothetical protein
VRSTRRRTLPGVASSVLCALFWTAPGGAQTLAHERAAVLLFSGCSIEGAPARAVSDALALELDSVEIRLKRDDEGLGQGDLLLVVRGGCAGSEPLTLRASIDREHRDRTLGLDDVPASARARTLALSLAELAELLLSGTPPASVEATVAQAGSEPTVEPEAPKKEAPARKPEPTPKQPKPNAKTTEPPPRAPIVFPEEQEQERLANIGEQSADFLELVLEGRVYGFSQFMWGGRLQFELGPVTFGGEALYGTADSALGAVTGLVASGVFGVRLFERRLSRHFRFLAGPRLGVGIVTASGAPLDSVFQTQALEPYFDLAATGDLRLETGEGAGAALSLELGGARGLVALADGERVAEFGGFFVGFSLGIGVSL